MNEATIQKAVAKPVPGQPLPMGFVNPPRGQIGHLCLDHKKMYQPNWWQLMLRRPEGSQSEWEYFGLNEQSWYVPYNLWVDVPPQVVMLLEQAQSDVLQSNVNQATGDYEGDLTKPGVTMKVIDRIPAFSYTLLPSA